MELRDICIEIAKKYNIDSIGLFGSRARGDFHLIVWELTF